jgi:histone H3/H4
MAVDKNGKKIVRYSYSKPKIGTPARHRFNYGERLLTYNTKLMKAREARIAREIKAAPDGQDGGGVQKVSRRSWKSIFPMFISDVAKWFWEIKHYQKSTSKLIPLRSFSRLIREYVHQECRSRLLDPYRMSREALAALQEITEEILTMLFELAYILLISLNCRNLAAIHAKRVTIMPKDMKLVRRIIGRVDSNHCLSDVK